MIKQKEGNISYLYVYLMNLRKQLHIEMYNLSYSQMSHDCKILQEKESMQLTIVKRANSNA